jgi:DHA2 family multidrug resistance protein
MLANIMQGLDTTIANVALPHIRGSLSASLDQISWVLTSYIVAAAITMPLTGWLAGRFGIKQVFILRSPVSRSPRRSAVAPPISPSW